MFVCCERCVLSRRGICDELITRPEESYRLWRVVVCDLVNLMNEEALAHWGGCCAKRKKEKSCILIVIFIILSRCTDS